MSTWDDKPNDYEHALAEIDALVKERTQARVTAAERLAEIEQLRAQAAHDDHRWARRAS